MPTTSHPIRSNITAGSVYYYNDPELRSTYPHYCIVINVDPSKDTVVFLVYASHKISKVRKRRKGCPNETLVEITPNQYPGFNKKTIIDCNHPLERSINMLVKLFNQRKLEIKTTMGIRLVKILRKGVIASNEVIPRIKDLLRD